MSGRRKWSETRAAMIAADPSMAQRLEEAAGVMDASIARYEAAVAAAGPLPAEGPVSLEQAQAEHDRLLDAAREQAGPDGDVLALHDVSSCVCCCWTCEDLAERIDYTIGKEPPS